jgi:hypothetical protein
MRTANHSYLASRVLAPLLALLCASCLDTASKNNDNTQSVAGASGRAAGSGGGKAGAAAAGKGGASGAAAGGGGMPAAGMSAEDDGGAPTAGESGDAGTGATGMPDPSLVTGTGTMCSSYGMAMDGKCAGYFCGVDLETLTKAVDPMAKCGNDVDLLCRNSVITAVGTCARQVKSQMPAATNEVLRPMVEACVFQDAEIKANVSSDCLLCTIMGAECAAANCLGECLAGDSALCDSCRKTNNCELPVFECGGIPAPF